MSNFPIKPVGNKLIVLPLKKEKVTVAGIEMDETPLSKGKVVSISDDILGLVNEGDVVYFQEKAALGQAANGEVHQWLTIDDIHGIKQA